MVESHITSITPAKHADRHAWNEEDPLTGDIRINILDKCYAVTPTITPTWETPASTLHHITDGVISNATTGGADTVNGADEEVIKLDLGAIYSLARIYYNFKMLSTIAGDVTIYIDTSEEDTVWRNVVTLSSTVNASYRYCRGIEFPKYRTRYIRIRAIQSGASTLYSYQVSAIQAY